MTVRQSAAREPTGRTGLRRATSILGGRLAILALATATVVQGAWVMVAGCATCGVAAELAALAGPSSPAAERAKAERAATLNRTTFGPFPPVTLGVEEFLDRPGGDAARARDAVRAVLAERPALAEAWLGLAQLSLANGGSVPSVVPLVEASRWFGPKEGRLMVRRAVLGIARWDELDARQRAAAVAEAVQTVASPGEFYQVLQVREALTRQTPAVRRTILADMAAAVPNGAAAVRRLALN